MEDRATLRMCCRDLLSVLGPFERVRTGQWKRSGSYNDQEELFQEFPKLTRRVNRMRFSIKWKDQGWGNRKSYFVLKLFDGTNLISSFNIFGIAEHDWETKTIEFSDEQGICDAARPGYHYELWRYVGGGGGHHMYVQWLRRVIEYGY